jgi:hypothetical protein
MKNRHWLLLLLFLSASFSAAFACGGPGSSSVGGRMIDDDGSPDDNDNDDDDNDDNDDNDDVSPGSLVCSDGGTVCTDSATGLMWQNGAAVGTVAEDQAAAGTYCAGLTWGAATAAGGCGISTICAA